MADGLDTTFSSLPNFMLHLQDLLIPDSLQLAFGAVACLGVVLTARACLTALDGNLPLPPSPPTWRLQGHFLHPPNQFLTVDEWIGKYGPLITIRSGIQRIVFIGRYKAAVDIMERQGASSADRPRMVATGEMLCGGHNIVFAHVGDRLRRMRRALHVHLQPKAADEYRPIQMSHAKKLVSDILDDPSNFPDHAITFSAATILKVAYGKHTPTAMTDPEVIEIRQVVVLLRKVMTSGTYLVEWIPWLKHLPWYGQELRHGCERRKRLYTNQLNHVRQQMQSNEDVGPSFAKDMLENGHLYDMTETEMISLTGTLFGAGYDTVSLAICTVLMAAARFPEEQAKVQAELDEVIGRDRAPTFADQQSLPRLRAFISEALRWRPLTPSGLAHRTTNDVIWENYRIPAGTTVFANPWSILRDPEVFPEPHEFKPERWINDKGALRDDPKSFFFGFGRRACPGQHVANRSLFITSALVLWAFQLTLDRMKPFDDMGYINGNHRSCSIEFTTRVPATRLRYMMEDSSEETSMT